MDDRIVIVKVKKLSVEAQMPRTANPGDVAFDLYSLADYNLEPGNRHPIPTGIAVEIPKGYEGQIRPRSGLGLKYGLTVINTPGTIDSGYRGEVRVTLLNLGNEAFQVHKGMRIAQLAIRPVPNVQFLEVDELSETERGEGGFGSSGH
ncbi:MAG: dUTP diphosphatase [Candidatus Thorarchaeota archaeon]|jgi:dUTP pyrophosphatase